MALEIRIAKILWLMSAERTLLVLYFLLVRNDAVALVHGDNSKGRNPNQ